MRAPLRRALVFSEDAEMGMSPPLRLKDVTLSDALATSKGNVALGFHHRAQPKSLTRPVRRVHCFTHGSSFVTRPARTGRGCIGLPPHHYYPVAAQLRPAAHLVDDVST